MPLPSKGDYIQYYWIEDTCHRGHTDGDGWKLFYVITIGSRWITMLNLSNLCICRVSRTIDMTNIKHVAARYYAKLPSYIGRVAEMRGRFGLQVSQVAIRKALALNGV